jgi:hypothetical protein
VALAAASVGKRLGFKGARYVFVSLQQAGLRQSYFENGRVRFSRLSRVDFSDPGAIAQDCAAESVRIQQYLVNTRILPRDAPALDVLMLAPSGHKALYDAVCVNSGRLQFHVHDLDTVGRSVGLKSVPAETLAEGLFLHVLADSPPREQFADNRLRRFYNLWRARVGLVAAGAAIFGFCLLVSGAKLLDIYELNEQAATDRQQEARMSEQYARLHASFPRTPTSTENLKAIVKNYRTLLRQSASPGSMLAEISEAVTALPQIEIERLDWEIGTLAKTPAGGGAAKAPSAPPEPAGAEFQVQTAEISLRRRDTEVTQTQLPFDINAEKSISGDIGAQQQEEVPRFSVMVSKRRGT